MTDAVPEPTAPPAETHRLDAFVDAAFAFAVTLLIIAGTDPMGSFRDLLWALKHAPAFAVSFSLIVLFWSAHRGFGRRTSSRDGPITLISLAIVFTVLIYVFPLRLLAETGVGWASGGRLPGKELVGSLDDLSGIFVAYGIGFSFLCALFILLNHAGRAHAHDDMAAIELGHSRNVWLICLAAGLLSAGLAASPLIAAAPWLPGCAYWLIPAGIGLYYAVKGGRPAAA